MHPTSNTRNLVLFGVGLGAAHRAQVSCELLSRANPGTPPCVPGLCNEHRKPWLAGTEKLLELLGLMGQTS